MRQFLSSTTAWLLTALLSAHAAYGQGTGNSKAATASNKPPAPLVLAEQGSFVNEQQVQTSFGAALGTRSTDLAKVLGVSAEDFEQHILKHPYAAQYVAAAGRVTADYQVAAARSDPGTRR